MGVIMPTDDCECETPCPRHSGCHPTSCARCGGIVE